MQAVRLMVSTERLHNLLMSGEGFRIFQYTGKNSGYLLIFIILGFIHLTQKILLKDRIHVGAIWENLTLCPIQQVCWNVIDTKSLCLWFDSRPEYKFNQCTCSIFSSNEVLGTQIDTNCGHGSRRALVHTVFT